MISEEVSRGQSNELYENYFEREEIIQLASDSFSSCVQQ